MTKPRVKEAVVVEGKYDVNAVKRALDATVVALNGFGIYNRKDVLALIRRLAETRGVVLLTDSDSAGNQIRNYLRGAVPDGRVLNARIPSVAGKEKRKARPSKAGTLGVEGMTDQIIIDAVRKSGAELDGEAVPERRAVTKAELYADGFSGREDSAALRAKLCEAAGLPRDLTANALLDAINSFYGAEGYEKLKSEVSR